MEITNIRRLSFEELCSIHENCIQRDFSKNAVRPLKMVQKLAKKELYIAYGAYNNNTLIAYATFYSFPDSPVVLLDYFAVEPQYRGKGIGSSFFREIRIKGIVKSEFKHAKILAIECENPDFAKNDQEKQTDIKRTTFYTQNGAILTDSKIFAFGVHYRILYIKLDSSYNHSELGKSVYDLYLYGFNPFLKGFAKKCLNYSD